MCIHACMHMNNLTACLHALIDLPVACYFTVNSCSYMLNQVLRGKEIILLQADWSLGKSGCATTAFKLKWQAMHTYSNKEQ